MMPLPYQQLISDLLVLAGMAAAVLSVLLAVIALARTQPPRSGALMLVLAILLVAAGGWSSTQPLTPGFLGEAWSRVFSDKPAPGPAPVPEPAPETAPEAAPEAPATGG